MFLLHKVCNIHNIHKNHTLHSKHFVRGLRRLLPVALCLAMLTACGSSPASSKPATTDNSVTAAPSPTPLPGLSDYTFPEGMPVVPPAGQKTADEESEEPIRGIYISGPIAGTYLMDDFIRMADETELNAFVIDIKNDSGEVTYHMDAPSVQAIESDINYIPDLETLVQTCKEHGIYLIARVVAFKDPYLAQARPELALHKSDGSIFYDNSGLAWVNPYDTAVWDYLMEISKAAAAIGFDEIQFDYVRFSTDRGMQDVDFGPAADGKDKTQIITEFMEYAYDTLSAVPVKVSADVFGTIIDNDYDQTIVGQEYSELAAHCDFICPMVYPSHYGPGVYNIAIPDAAPYDTVFTSMIASKKVLDEYGNGFIASLETRDNTPHAKVRPWLQAFTATWVSGHIPYTPSEVRAQIQAVYDAGYEEWILWNAAVKYDQAYFEPSH